MEFLVISKERLLHHIDYDIRKSALGIINWYVGDQDGFNVLHVLISLRGVNYLYRQSFVNRDEIDPNILQFMSSDRSVLGFASFEEEKPLVQESVPLFNNFFSTGVVD